MFVPLAGFLGTGKTTKMIAAARALEGASGRRVSVVTNDQGTELVDTTLARSALPLLNLVGEVTGGCFCCRFDDLMDTVTSLIDEQHADTVIAEAVGSCTDRDVSIDYDRYAAAEAGLAWLNRAYSLSARDGFEPDAWALRLLAALSASCTEAGVVVGKASLTAAGGEPRLDVASGSWSGGGGGGGGGCGGAGGPALVERARAVLNARVACPPEDLDALTSHAVRGRVEARRRDGGTSDRRVLPTGVPAPSAPAERRRRCVRLTDESWTQRCVQLLVGTARLRCLRSRGAPARAGRSRVRPGAKVDATLRPTFGRHRAATMLAKSWGASSGRAEPCPAEAKVDATLRPTFGSTG